MESASNTTEEMRDINGVVLNRNDCNDISDFKTRATSTELTHDLLVEEEHDVTQRRIQIGDLSNIVVSRKEKIISKRKNLQTILDASEVESKASRDANTCSDVILATVPDVAFHKATTSSGISHQGHTSIVGESSNNQQTRSNILKLASDNPPFVETVTQLRLENSNVPTEQSVIPSLAFKAHAGYEARYNDKIFESLDSVERSSDTNAHSKEEKRHMTVKGGVETSAVVQRDERFFDCESTEKPLEEKNCGNIAVTTAHVCSAASQQHEPLPFKITTFTTHASGITQEYVFPCPSTFMTSRTDAVSNSVKDLCEVDGQEADSNSELECQLQKQEKKSIVYQESDSELDNKLYVVEQDDESENLILCDNMSDQKLLPAKNANILDSAGNMPSRKRLQRGGRKSLSAPTSPVFSRSTNVMNNLLHKHVSCGNIGSNLANKDVPHSLNSLASSALGLQLSVLLGNSPDVTKEQDCHHVTDPKRDSQKKNTSSSTGVLRQYEPSFVTTVTKHDAQNLSEPNTSVCESTAPEAVATYERGQSSFCCARNDAALFNWKVNGSQRRRSETVYNSFQESDESRSKSDRVNSRADTSESEHSRPTARRAAVVSTLPDSDLSCLSDTIANLQRNQPVGISADFKRSKWNFRNFMTKDKDRSKGLKLEQVLRKWTSKEPDFSLTHILNKLGSCKGEYQQQCVSDEQPPPTLSEIERRRHEATWELFTSERTYLIHHLLVLRQVFMEPLQQLQCDGYLLSIDVRGLFGNLEELCEVSLDFCRGLLDVVGDERPHEFGCADAIVTAFETFRSKMCPPYQRYCTSYGNSLMYREDLKPNEDFTLYLKWCERNPRCQRLKLSDLLIAPMQHLTKYPLLLRQIAKYTAGTTQNASIEKTLLAVQHSLKALEGNVTWLTHFQFLQDLQDSICWPPVYELDTKTPLPEALRHSLSQQPCRNLIASPKRQLVHDGVLSVVEQHGRLTEIYVLLFDDMMLFTKPSKKPKRKISEIPSTLKRHSVLKDGTQLVVHRQPVALDRFMVYDVEPEQASSLGVKNAFIIVQENRFQQMTIVTMLQASSEEIKRTWLTQLASTAAQWMEKFVYGKTNITSSIRVTAESQNDLQNGERTTTENAVHGNKSKSRLHRQINVQLSMASSEDNKKVNGVEHCSLPENCSVASHDDVS